MKVFKKENSAGLRWIIKNCKRDIPYVVLISVFYIILALVNTVVALLSKYAIDAAQHAAETEGAARDAFIHKIFFWGVVILVVITARLVIRVLASAIGIKVTAKLTMRFRTKLFYGILNKKYEDINKIHSGELINRLTSDINIVTEGVIGIIPNLLYYITQFVGAFVVLVVIAPKFTILFLIAGVLISIITLLLRKKFKGLHKEVQSTEGVVRSFFQEAIESMLVVKTFGAEDTFREKGDDYQEINYWAKMKRRRVSILANAGFSFVFNAGYLAALVWAAIKVAMGALTYGTLTAMLQLIGQIQAPFVNITKVVPDYYAIIASAERIIEIEEIENEEKDVEEINAPEFYKNFNKAEFANIKFNYGRESVLEEGNAEFDKGDFVAIRGISGIGKSTLMKMLLGVFTPNEGTIRLYENNGQFVDASPSTRSLFSYVPQGNYLFSGTLRDNIKLINPYATDEDIHKALEISSIDDFVDTLPDGLDTVLGEKGTGVSEGQAQRLAIARAIVSDAPIILLDEATSALDAETEKRVLDNIKSLNSKTCVIITHKNAALQVCNKEFLIDNKILTMREL
ncbi:MAG: ABC transporter ATP-binding protein [Eubacterium sp.]|nr:ABC transporter ATP-binding protein [Eubacterium sp.]